MISIIPGKLTINLFFRCWCFLPGSIPGGRLRSIWGKSKKEKKEDKKTMRKKERTWRQRRRNTVNKMTEIRKIFEIPAITADRSAAFFEDENPEGFAEYENQINRTLWQYMDIINAPGFRALELPKPSGCGSLILHKSTRDGVDYQLSYIDASGVPVMHEDYNADGSGWRSISWVYDELARQSFYGAATVTALYYQ